MNEISFCDFATHFRLLIPLLRVILNYCFTLRSHSLYFAYAKLSFVLLRATSSFVISSLTILLIEYALRDKRNRSQSKSKAWF